ncbi:hypothetical protein AB1E22_02175 [Buttiauxella gaviniae]|uniref:Uncharacterized protein n=1 Tax=Buttiauxella gaviniae TaxID=82990 RepID=A0ABV3NPS8_9ENTR
MNWLSVRNLNISLTAILVVFLGVMHLHTSSANAKSGPIKGRMEIGFYDLMSDQREVYNAQIMDMDEALLFTLTRTEDPMFVLRGRLDETRRKHGRVFYDYVPIRYSNPENYKLVFSFIDFLRHNTVWVYPMTVNKKPLVIGQSGMMFLFPLNA